MNQSTLVDRTPPSRTPLSPTRRHGAWLMVASTVALVAVGFSAMMRPPSRGADTPFADFSAARANTHIQKIAQEPHPMGSSALRLVEAYITGQLVGMGLQPEIQPVDVPDYFGGPGEMTTVRNIVATIPGTQPSKAIALVAHYDTTPATPGANDDSAGIAVLLEVARATLAGDRPMNDIVLLFTDGEEPNPRFGANAFAEFHPAFADIGLTVNLEAIGSSGPSMLVESSLPETGIVDSFRSTAPDPAAFSFLTETVALFGGVGTDFDVFKDHAIPGLSFAYLRGSPIYHTDRDAPSSVSLKSVQHHGDNVMAVIRAFGNQALPLSQSRADAVFFAVTPLWTAGYSSFVADALAVIAVVAFGAVGWLRLRSNRDTVGSVLRGALVTFAGSIAAALVVFVAWWAFTAVRSTPRIWESYAYLSLLCFVAALVLSFVGGALAGRYSDRELGTGIVAVWVMLGAVTTILLPGFSYLFIWPALGGVVALAVGLSGRIGGWLWLVVAAPAVVLAIPALDAFFQMAQPRPGNPDSALTAAVGPVGFLVALIVGLIVAFRPRFRHRF